ncbi:hypothetical protein GDO81_011098 [Engystomops pustulosus]|uniref:Uncharacterized protein n=1 Tax=Engystomops pustulosus TaxID=76066 RepID=A0AAV7C4M1_ENGPU|nr:hypothetical protein GDO81_011098 [Engystomops pustulosus]
MQAKSIKAVECLHLEADVFAVCDPFMQRRVHYCQRAECKHILTLPERYRQRFLSNIPPGAWLFAYLFIATRKMFSIQTEDENRITN